MWLFVEVIDDGAAGTVGISSSKEGEKCVYHVSFQFLKSCMNGSAGIVGTSSCAEESGDGAQAGSQCHHEHPEEALHQALQPQAV